MDYPNFYENISEARIRLNGTVVLYDKAPFFIMCITNHMGDIFRVYLQPLDKVNNPSLPRPPCRAYGADFPTMGEEMDKYMEKHPSAEIIRKHINSPLFDKFRPFPLGMCNLRGKYAYYVERQPSRHTRQGLTNGMLYQSLMSASETGKRGKMEISLFSPEFYTCVLGVYPSPNVCLERLNNPKVIRDSVGIHRNFALIRGPIEMLFLGYKQDIIGVLPKNDFSEVKLGSQYPHTKEVVSELGIFRDINT